MADTSNSVKHYIISTTTNYFIFLEWVYFKDTLNISIVGLE